jgi:hypothetical protein
MNDEHDLMDQLLDSSLASYTPAAARPGLEQRILASVAAAGESRSWSWMPLAALAAAALVAVVAISLTFKPARSNLAVLHPPAAAHLSQAAPAPHSFTAHLQPAAAPRVLHANAASSAPGLIAPMSIAPLRNPPLTEESLAWKPLTITPIQIEALN